MKKETRIKEIAEKVMEIFDTKGRIPLDSYELEQASNNSSEWSAYRDDVLDLLVYKNKWVAVNDKNIILFSLTDEGIKYLENLE